ncbi:MAG TPA: lysylphosphatidylglycerol synthase domain-containing protein, partial [Thermohalobaculum sp.]|nr:lysylphosphatidylglycerol synthase domain-containing protein [Thermohalobaculum sp.]
MTILALTAYLAIRRSTIKIGRFRIDAPSLTVIARQMVFTALDLVFAASTLYILPPASDLGFTTFVAIFIVAMNAGMLSHVPGGIGVFESIVIAALPASIPLEPAAAALLLYRLIYYLLPFAAAVMLLALLELRMVGTRAKQRLVRAAAAAEPIMRSVSAIVPVAMAAMVFVSGLWMLFSALIPNINRTAGELEHLLPLAFVEGG